MRDGSRLKITKGLTLLEIVICVSLLAIIATTFSLIFRHSLSTYRKTIDKSNAAQEAQTAMEWVVRDIQAARAIILADDDTIGLVDYNYDYVQYELVNVGGSIRIMRKGCTGPSYLLVKDVSGFSLKYFDGENNEILNPAQYAVYNPSLKTIEIDIGIEKNDQEFKLNSVASFVHDSRYPWFKVYGRGLTSEETSDFLTSICPISGSIAK